MKPYRPLAAAILVLYVAATGCSSMRELPIAEVTSDSASRGMRVMTVDGLVYDFDEVTVTGDSLVGQRVRTDLEGPASVVVTHRIALADVQRAEARRMDWARTGMTAGGVLAAVLVAGLGAAIKKSSGGSSGGSSSGGGGRID
jgi:hypothetical protein